MQMANAPKGRSESGIVSKISVPAGKIPEQPGDKANDAPVKPGSAIGGFSGSGVIAGKIK